MSLGWDPGTSLPARAGRLIYAGYSHRCFPLLFLLTAHTSNSWDAPRQPLISVVCRPAHIPPGQGASCLPHLPLESWPLSLHQPWKAQLDTRCAQMPHQKMSWVEPHGEYFVPKKVLVPRLQGWPPLPPWAQGMGFVGTLRTFTDFPDFLHLFQLPQKVPLCRWPPPWGNASRDLERGTGWGSALDAARCQRRRRQAASACLAPRGWLIQ